MRPRGHADTEHSPTGTHDSDRQANRHAGASWCEWQQWQAKSVCLCVCVRERERERKEGEGRQTDRQTDRQKDRQSFASGNSGRQADRQAGTLAAGQEMSWCEWQ